MVNKTFHIMKPSLNSVVISKSLANLDAKGLTIIADKFGSRALELMLGIDTELEISEEIKMFLEKKVKLSIVETDIFDKRVRVAYMEPAKRYFTNEEDAYTYSNGHKPQYSGNSSKSEGSPFEGTSFYENSSWINLPEYNGLPAYVHLPTKISEI